jgi:TP901 family phage tail tape measure protein
MANNQVVYTIKVNGDASGGKRSLAQIGTALDQAGKQAQELFDHFQKLGQANRVAVNIPVMDGKNKAGEATAKIDAGKNTAQALDGAANKLQNDLLKSNRTGKQFFSEMMNGANRFVNGLRMMGQAVQELGFLLSTFVSAPLILLLKGAFNGAVEFEAQMARVRKAVDSMDATQFANLEQRIRNLAKITPTTATELAGITEEIGQLGVQGNGVYRMLNLVNKAVIGTGVSAQGFATDLGRVAAALGMDLNTEEGMQDLEDLASVMDLVAKRTSTDMDGIMAAVKDAAVVGGMLKNLAPKDLVAGLGVLITSGVDPSAAGNTLQRWYVQVMKNSDKFASAMKGYSRDIVDANGKITGSFQPYGEAADVIQRINDEPIKVLTDSLIQLNEVADEDKAQALKNMFDYSGLVGGRVGAMATNYDDLKQLLIDVDAEWANAITLQADYEQMLHTTDSAVKIFKNNISDLGITIGNYVMPYINQAIEYAIPIIQDLGEAFKGLDENTKLLVVAIPLLGAVLGPVLFIFGTLFHFLFLTASGITSMVTGIGIWVFKLSELVIRLGGVKKVLSPLGKLFGLVGKSAATAGGEAAAASGFFGSLIGTILKFASSIAAIPLAIIGSLKVLSMFGLDVSTFFENMAAQAKAWGEKLMITYGNGILGGAARVISKVVTTVAGWIARFFESHSPPEEGPLSTIDQWGSALMNTYMKGFLEADFDILSQVGQRIERAFEIFASLNNLDLGSLNDTFMKFREQIAQVIDTFNKTGQVAEDVLGQIGNNLGTLGKDIQELVRLWLKYKQLQEKLAALDRKKKDTLKNYDAEIAKISKMNITAEEKAELIRQAMMNRDDELRGIEQEKKATEEQADAAKEKLDWQKEYIDAQLEFLEMLKKEKKNKEPGSGAGDEMAPVELGNLEDQLGGVGSTVKDLGEEFNSWSEKITRARGALEQFKNAFRGKAFGERMSQEELTKWQQEDPEGYKRAQDLYNLGLKAKDSWEQVSGPVKAVAGFFSSMKSTSDSVKSAMDGIANSPFIDVLQGIWDAATANVDIFAPLENAFESLDESLSRAGETLGITDLNWKKVLTTLGAVVVFILTVVIGTIILIATTLINVFASVVEYLSKIVGNIIEQVTGFIGGFIEMLRGLWDVVRGLMTANWQQVLQGVATFLHGLYQTVSSGFLLVQGTVMHILEGLLVIVMRILRDLWAFIVQIFKGKEAADQFRKWADDQVKAVQSMFDQWFDKFNGFKDKVKGWYDTIMGWLSKLTNLNFSFNGTVNANNNSGGSAINPQNNAAGGITPLNKPILSWVGEGKEQEAIIPLSKLPSLMESMYSNMQPAVVGGGIVLNINNPVVREDKDIDRIANAVARKLGKKTNNSSRLGSGMR